MKRQLILLDSSPSDWRIDEHTREAGRHGLAAARAALELAKPPEPSGVQSRPTGSRSRRRPAPFFASPHGPTAA
jgi:hypothetical protein